MLLKCDTGKQQMKYRSTELIFYSKNITRGIIYSSLCSKENNKVLLPPPLSIPPLQNSLQSTTSQAA